MCRINGQLEMRLLTKDAAFDQIRMIVEWKLAVISNCEERCCQEIIQAHCQTGKILLHFDCVPWESCQEQNYVVSNCTEMAHMLNGFVYIKIKTRRFINELLHVFSSKRITELYMPINVLKGLSKSRNIFWTTVIQKCYLKLSLDLRLKP